MKIQYKGKEWDVRLKTLYQNYNCSVKMVGRLSVEGAPPGYQYDKEFFALLEPIKKDLIHDWLKSLDDRQTFPELKENNVIFPNDSGKYLPSVLLFSDAVGPSSYAGQHWAQSFLFLLKELEKDPSYGCTVIGLPYYHNRTYGNNPPSGPRLSRVWAIYPPSMQGLLFTPKNEKLTSSLKEWGKKQPIEEIKLAVA